MIPVCDTNMGPNSEEIWIKEKCRAHSSCQPRHQNTARNRNNDNIKKQLRKTGSFWEVSILPVRHGAELRA